MFQFNADCLKYPFDIKSRSEEIFKLTLHFKVLCNDNNMKQKRYLFSLIAGGGLLSIPAIAMLFTPEVNWDRSDFVLMGTILFVLIPVIELSLRKIKSISALLAAISFALLLFLLLWAELAVGIFGSPFAGQ